MIMKGKYERTSAASRGYGHRWRKERLAFLQINPLCKFCTQAGKVTAANVVDHIKPHKGNQELFWDTNNWQPLCKTCHDSTKARIESGKDLPVFGEDGFPV